MRDPESGSRSCPGVDQLERVACGDAVEPHIVAHVADCASCMQEIRQIKGNLAFLTSVAAALHRGSHNAPSSQSPAVPTDLVPGYSILQELQRGSQGIVYTAVQDRTKRRVAVKMLLQGAFATDRQRQRFEHEIEVAAGLRHPGIVTVYDSAPVRGGRLAYAMEYVDGGLPLDQWCKPARPESAPKVQAKLLLFALVCDAVHYAHQRAIIHRDLKPANILVDAAGLPRILDFGIAKTLGRADQRHTQTGEFAGTLAYASPEQIDGRPDGVDTRTDVYSLGVILFEMLGGRLPHQLAGHSISEAARIVTQVNAPRLGEINTSCRGDLDTIAAKALERDAARRYQSAAALAADVRCHLAGRTIEARRDSTWYVLRKMAGRHKLFVATAIAGAIGVLAFSGAMAALAASRDRERERLAVKLSERNIDLGLQQALNCYVPEGESSIWPELIRAGCTTIDHEDLLFTAPSDVLHPLWALWQIQTLQPCLLTAATAGGYTHCLSFSRQDSRLSLLSGDFADSAWFLESWDVGACHRLARTPFQCPMHRLRGWRFGPEHDLAAGIGAGRLILARLSTGSVLADVELPGIATGKGAFSHRGDRLAVIDDQKRLTLWELPSLRLLTTVATDVPLHAAPMFDDDDSKLIAIDASMTVRMWGMDGQPLPGGISLPPELVSSDLLVDEASMEPLEREHRSSPFQIELRSGVPALAVVRNGCISCWAGVVTSPRIIRIEPCGKISSISMSSDGSRLATLDPILRRTCVWNLATGRPVVTFTPGSGTLSGQCAISSDGALVATASQNKLLKVWEVEPDAWVRARLECGGTIHSLRFFDDSRRLVECGHDGALRLVNTIDKSILRTDLTQRKHVAKCLDVSPDGEMIASVSEDGKLWMTAAATGTTMWSAPVTFMREPFQYQTLLSFVRFTHDGTRLVVAGMLGDMTIFDTASGREVGLLAGGHSKRISALAFSPDGRTLASTSVDQTCVLWDLETRTPRLTLRKHTNPIRSVCFTPDGERLVTAGDDGWICLWNATTGRLELPPMNAGKPTYSVAIHPNGAVAASGETDGTVKFWDLRNGRELASFNYHSAAVFCLEFSPDGKNLVSGSADSSLRIWDLRYYNRHLRNNLAYWVEQQRTKIDAESDESN